MEGRGGEGRGGEGRAGQGRVPDCLGGLSRVGISSRSTRPWNGQPPSFDNVKHMSNNGHINVLEKQFDFFQIEKTLIDTLI